MSWWWLVPTFLVGYAIGFHDGLTFKDEMRETLHGVLGGLMNLICGLDHPVREDDSDVIDVSAESRVVPDDEFKNRSVPALGVADWISPTSKKRTKNKRR